MKILVLLFEGAEKEFIKKILVKQYNFSSKNDNNTRFENTGATLRILFPHPGEDTTSGKGAFDKKPTYIACRNRAEKSFLPGEIQELPIYYILLRDTDTMDIDDTAAWLKYAKKYETLFTDASCHHKGCLKIKYCQRRMENWYISGLSNEHFGDGKLLNEKYKKTLMSAKSIETMVLPNRLTKFLNNSSIGQTGLAVSIAEHFDINLAKEKSHTFKGYIELIESLM